jgi:Flp pilus assembly pilin Flp
MLAFYCKVKALWATRDRGASAAEYALLIALVTAVLFTIVVLFRQVIEGAFKDTCDAIQNDSNNTC